MKQEFLAVTKTTSGTKTVLDTMASFLDFYKNPVKM
jgi:hypothetical protein